MTPRRSTRSSACLAKDPEDRWQSAHDVLRSCGGSRRAPGGRRRRVISRVRPRTGVAGLDVSALAADGPGRLRVAAATRSSLLPARGALTSAAGRGTFQLNRVGWARRVYRRTGGPRFRRRRKAAGKRFSCGYARSDAVAAKPLPGTEGARLPFWSPDSRFIAFFTAGRLLRIDVSGGPPRALCDVDGLAYGGSWEPTRRHPLRD